jgi:hypothetical protein
MRFGILVVRQRQIKDITLLRGNFLVTKFDFGGSFGISFELIVMILRSIQIWNI